MSSSALTPKSLIEQLLIVKLRRLPNGTAGYIPHGIKSVGLQLFCVASAYAPEISQRPVRPEGTAVAHLVQFGDAHAVFIRLNVFGSDVHGHFTEIEIRADPGGGCNAGLI